MFAQPWRWHTLHRVCSSPISVDGFLVPSFHQSQLCHEIIIVPWLKAYFLHQIFGVFLFLVHAQPFRNIVDSRSLHLVAISLLLHGPFSLLVPFYAQQLFFPYLEFNISGLRCIHHLFPQMLLDDFCQIAFPCLLVLFGNEWRTLLTIEDVLGEWLKVEVPEEGFVLGVVEFHNMFMIIILNYSLKSEQSINKSIIFAILRMASLPLKRI